MELHKWLVVLFNHGLAVLLFTKERTYWRCCQWRKAPRHGTTGSPDSRQPPSRAANTTDSVIWRKLKNIVLFVTETCYRQVYAEGMKSLYLVGLCQVWGSIPRVALPAKEHCLTPGSCPAMPLMSPWKRSGLYNALAARGMVGEAATAATTVARSTRRSLRKYRLPVWESRTQV